MDIFISKLKPTEIEDLVLWCDIINFTQASSISINNITFTKPNEFSVAYVCTKGMCGYTISGLEWIFPLPISLLDHFSINFLEFMAYIITIDLLICTIPDTKSSLHIVALSENSSTVEWLHTSSFCPSNQQELDILARWISKRLLFSNNKLFPQHIKGESNVIDDSLSRDFTLSDSELLNKLNFEL